MPAIVLEGQIKKTIILRRPSGLAIRGHWFEPDEKQPRPTIDFGPLFVRTVDWQSPGIEHGIEFRGTVYHNRPPQKSDRAQQSECKGGFTRKKKRAVLVIRIVN